MMEGIRREKITNLAALCGIAGPLIMGLGMLVSGLGYVGIGGQKYSLSNHFVSELGELGVSDLAGAFNSGLLLGGILSTVFMLFLAYQIKSWLRFPLGALGVVATVSGALVGVYPMNNLDMHIQVATLFFNLGMLISFLYSMMFLFSRKHMFPKWLTVPGLVNAGLFFLFLNFTVEGNDGSESLEGLHALLQNRPDIIPLALLEWTMILGIMVWILLLGLYLYAQQKDVAA